ncbi:MAG: glycosyltransferase family 39 protein, partial [Syntrophaceae bacterium]|nr:glycosyltransferase family 39 protein [Syntrophaceae bacterium]
MLDQREKLLLFLLCVFCSLPILWRLGDSPIQLWDESLFGLRAIIFAETGNYPLDYTYITAYNDRPNTKPPLITLLQALSLKSIGYSEFALRIPIAIMSIFCAILIYFFFLKYIHNSLAGLISAILLVSNEFYLSMHVARSANHDAPFALFTTTLCLSAYLYLMTEDQRRNIYLWSAGASLSAALFVKGFFVLALAPGFLIFLIARGDFLSVIRRPVVWITFLIPIALFSSWLFAMNLEHPGFWSR